jgi:hypothetical protein
MISEKELLNLIEKVLSEKRRDEAPECATDMAAEFERFDLEKHGMAWVKEGKVYIRDPKDGISFATITPAPGAELYVNGVQQSERVQVSSSDEIEVKLLKQEFPGKYKLEFTKDKMEARLSVEPTRIITYRLYYQEPQHNLILKTVSREEFKSPFDYKQFKDILAEANINTGIKYATALQFINSPEHTTITVAEGFLPEPPVGECFEILFPQNFEYTPVVKEDGTVDFHNLKNMYCVEEGALLAVRKPGIPGKPGLNVFGEEMMTPEPRPAVAHTGKGALLGEDGSKVFAKKPGRPVVKQSGQTYFFDVEDILIHDGDVDTKSGNLRFKGSLLIVRGNVKESMAIQTTGMIMVDGLVSGAKLIAQSNIRINSNAINSIIKAGLTEDFLKNLLTCINGIEKGFQQVIEICALLTSQSKVTSLGVSYGYLVKLVIEKKMLEIPEKMFKLNTLLRSTYIDLPDEVEKVIFTVNKVLVDPHLLSSEEEFFGLLQSIEFIRNFFNSLNVKKADLDLAGALNCELVSTGNTNIGKYGCFNTNIRAGGNVKIDSVLRGGEVRAGKNIDIREAGTETGVNTVIETNKKGVIRILHCNDGVVIKIGKRVSRVIGVVRNLVAKLNTEGNLDIHFNRTK